MTKNNKKGFTIIEVVLVLAIAGLIFLMVFIALPALQRSQRNTRRRQDMARILSAFNDYQANNNGKMPGTNDLANFVNRYVNAGGTQAPTAPADFANPNKWSCGNQDTFCDPDGSSYILNGQIDLAHTAAQKSDTFNHYIYYHINAKCGDGEVGAVKASGASSIAIVYTLEGGAIYCGDNQ
jgi:prepilin-type N-terminal cleavage/methylation domain-containing protein